MDTRNVPKSWEKKDQPIVKAELSERAALVKLRAMLGFVSCRQPRAEGARAPDRFA
jgi:hypothetical protein